MADILCQEKWQSTLLRKINSNLHFYYLQENVTEIKQLVTEKTKSRKRWQELNDPKDHKILSNKSRELQIEI